MSGRNVTAEERDWESCDVAVADCDNRVARFELGDFYCRKHAPSRNRIHPTYAYRLAQAQNAVEAAGADTPNEDAQELLRCAASLLALAERV